MRWNALRGAGSDPLQRSVPLKIDYDHDAELLRLQQLTAQRADQLAAASARPVDDLAIWLQAEAEVCRWSATSGRALVADGVKA